MPGIEYGRHMYIINNRGQEGKIRKSKIQEVRGHEGQRKRRQRTGRAADRKAVAAGRGGAVVTAREANGPKDCHQIFDLLLFDTRNHLSP